MKELSLLQNIADNNIKYSEWAKQRGLKGYCEELILETQELQKAIEEGEVKNIKDELGDVLWELIMVAEFCKKEYGIQLEESAQLFLKKIERRKPHIFEQKQVTIEEENAHWQKIKKQEKEILL